MKAPLFNDELRQSSRPKRIPPVSSCSSNVISALVSLNKSPVLLWFRARGKKIWRDRLVIRPIQWLKTRLASLDRAGRGTGLPNQELAASKQRHEMLQRELNQLAMLHAVAVAATEVSTTEELLKRVAQIVEPLFYPAKFGAGLLDPHYQILRIYTAPANLSEKPATLTLPPGQGLAGQVLSTGQPRHVPDVNREPIYRPLDSTTRSELCVPLRMAGQIVGVLNLESAQPDAFSPADEQLLLILANQLATALGHVNFFELTRRRAEEHETLAAISSALHKAPIQANMIPVIFDSLLNLLTMEGATLALLDQATGEMVIERGSGLAANLTHLRLPPGKGLNSHVAALGELYVNNNLPRYPLSVWPDIIPDIKAIAGAPLIAEGQLIGVLCVGRQKAINETGVRLLTSICDLAANAIRRARLNEQTQRLLQQTQHQARQLQQIMDTVPGGILVLDAQQRIMLTNPTAQEYLAVLANVAPDNILTHLNGQPMAALLQAASNGLRHEVELGGPPPRIFEVEAWLLHGEAHAGDSVLTLREISREREIQQRIQEQERLAAIGQLAAGIAHDFNNILTGIIGFAELALFYPNLVKGPEEALERIVQQGQRAIQLIRQILDFSRQSPTEKFPLDLAPLIRENLKLFERIIPEHILISLEIEPDYKPGKIEANPTQIQQILTNLAVNARDAMPNGGHLAFRLANLILPADMPPPYPGLLPGNWVILTVSDSGTGISGEVLSHIFEPFFTTKATTEGTGLGLAQVYGLVKQHSGEIEVTSQIGQGTTFNLYLPVALPDRESTFQEEDIETNYGHEEMILLVEDDLAVLNVLEGMLLALGYQALSATDGQQALDLYADHHSEIALVLTDMTMPQMSGETLAQTLHQQDPHLKIIAMSGYPQETEIKNASSQNFVAWLQKPLSLKELAQLLYQILEK